MFSPPHHRFRAASGFFVPILAFLVILSCSRITQPLDDEIERDYQSTQQSLELTQLAHYLETENARRTEAAQQQSAPLSREDAIKTAQAEAAQAAAPPIEALQPAPPAPAPTAPPAPASSPPVITRVDFPKAIPAKGVKFVGWTSFKDPDGDVILQRMEVVSSVSMKGFEDDPREGLFGSPTDGRYDFKIWCFRKQQVTMRVTLIDAAGNSSNSMDFSFECY